MSFAILLTRGKQNFVVGGATPGAGKDALEQRHDL
jgi:hypothetical protein